MKLSNEQEERLSQEVGTMHFLGRCTPAAIVAIVQRILSENEGEKKCICHLFQAGYEHAGVGKAISSTWDCPKHGIQFREYGEKKAVPLPEKLKKEECGAFTSGEVFRKLNEIIDYLAAHHE